MDGRTFSLSEALAFGWQTFKRNLGLSIGVGAGALGTMLIVNAVAESVQDRPVLVVGFGLLSQLLQIFWSLVWIRFALLLHDGRAVAPRELVPDMKTFLAFLGVSILYGLLVTAGLLLLILPGVYLAVRYVFATFLVADHRADVIDSFRRSATITHGARWRILGLMLILFVLNMIGAVLFGVGLLLTMPVSVFAMVLAYRRLAARVEEEGPLVAPQPVPVPT